jgi:homocysteine S-methyltransferase
MRAAINALNPKKSAQIIEVKPEEKVYQAKEIPIEKKSRLARRLADGHFVTTVEILSPFGVSAKNEIEKAREMFYFGIDAINIPDGPRASARMSGLALAVLIQREVGIETIMHYVCRDRNVIEMQSGLLGAYSLGVRNLLALTGDPPKLGNYPDATAVFDVDSIGLVNIISMLNHGQDIAGNPIGEPAGFFTGVGANPGAINLEEELRRLDWKIKAGADFIITQPVFDIRAFESFVRRVEHYGIPILAGLWPLVSIRNAEFMNNEMPGCSVPSEIMNRLRKHEGSKAGSIAEGIAISRETLETIRPMIRGLQISAPFGRVQSVVDILS